jgi:hypothetical protein
MEFVVASRKGENKKSSKPMKPPEVVSIKISAHSDGQFV